MLYNRLWSLASSFPLPTSQKKSCVRVWKTYRQKTPKNSSLNSSQFVSPTAQGPCGPQP